MNKEDLFSVLDGEVVVDNVEKWKGKLGRVKDIVWTFCKVSWSQREVLIRVGVPILDSCILAVYFGFKGLDFATCSEWSFRAGRW